MPIPKTARTAPKAIEPTHNAAREATFDIFRRWGFLQASLDPLGQYLAPEPFPTPFAPDGPDAEEARGYYCGSVGAEFMRTLRARRKRAWIQEGLERKSTSRWIRGGILIRR